MPTPDIKFCIVCEGVRPEPNNKATILGFFGALPDVSIGVGELNKNIATLVFAVGMTGPSDQIMLRSRILKPDNTVLMESPDKSFPALPQAGGGLAAIAFAPVIFSQEGDYSFQVFVNGEDTYKQNFEVVIRPSLG